MLGKVGLECPFQDLLNSDISPGNLERQRGYVVVDLLNFFLQGFHCSVGGIHFVFGLTSQPEVCSLISSWAF